MRSVIAADAIAAAAICINREGARDACIGVNDVICLPCPLVGGSRRLRAPERLEVMDCGTSAVGDDGLG